MSIKIHSSGLDFFGGCKMWDDSWTPIEHTEFTNKPFIEMITIIGGV